LRRYRPRPRLNTDTQLAIKLVPLVRHVMIARLGAFGLFNSRMRRDEGLAHKTKDKMRKQGKLGLRNVRIYT